MSLMIRPIEQNDAERCGRVGYQAHKTISSAHGYPSEQPSEEFGIELIRSLLGSLNSWGVLAERQGTVLGSIFLHKFPPSPVAVIGPLTVHPSAEGGIDRRLMDAALIEAHKQNNDH
jgi:predicted N-acetyltransferase YhbS